ncbi:MAG: hypothetical protein JXA97_13470 [Anaerolineales bacterium]|nr:hypothetical protein [Anaerolineales bacterium]
MAKLPRPALYVAIGGIFLSAMVGMFLLVLILVTLFISGFGGAAPHYPEDPLAIIESAAFDIDAASGRASLGAWSFELDENSVIGNGGISISTFAVNTLPNPDEIDLIDRLFGVQWLPYSVLPVQAVPFRVIYELDSLPEEIRSLPLQLFSYDGVDWLGLPTTYHTGSSRLSAVVQQPGVFAVGVQEDPPQYQGSVLRVQAEVFYTDGIAYADENGEAIPLRNARFALIRVEDQTRIAEGQLDSDGQLDIQLPTGLPIGSEAETTQFFLRVYAEQPAVATVQASTTPAAAHFAYDSEPVTMPSRGGSVRIPALTIPIESSGAFNILAAVQSGFNYAEEITHGWRPPHITVAWSDPTARGRWDTGFDPESSILYLGKSPQVAWDDDWLLSIYGHFLLHWLPEADATTCVAYWSGPDQPLESCSAWAEGWGYFFSSMVRQNPVFTAYKNSTTVKTSFNLETSEVPAGVDTAGAVMQVLWDLVDTNPDGENLTFSMERIIQTISQRGDMIQDIQGFYAAWLDTFGLDTALCARFAAQGYLQPAACGTTALAEVAPATPLPASTATPAPSELSCGATQTISVLGGNASTQLDFLLTPGKITTLYVENLQLEEGSILQLGIFTLDGEPRSTYTLRLGEPSYSISIPGEIIADAQPYSLSASSDGNGQVSLRLVCEDPPTPTPVPPPTSTPTPTEIPEPTPIAGLGTGDVQITLLWYSRVDLDLHATSPSGVTIFYENRSPLSGGFLDRDSNGSCASAITNPIENIYWPEGTAQEGEYIVDVVYFSPCQNDQGEQAYELIVRVDGRIIEQIFGTLMPGEESEVLRFSYP